MSDKSNLYNTTNLYNLFLNSSGICTDSRQVTPGCIFFALKGENFDGNKFAKQALEAGAICAVVDNPDIGENEKYIYINDVLKCLQKLAKHHRKQFSIPIIAVTGSNGKTTTKELISKVLSTKYKVLSTKGNLNNHIGVPITLLKIDDKTEVAVIEMGASAPGEIELLANIAQPVAGLITNIGKAHLLGFDSLEGVKKSKGELYDFLEKNGGIVFYNNQDSILQEIIAERREMITLPYGIEKSKIKILKPTSKNPFLNIITKENKAIKTKLIGSYNVPNLLAALAIGEYFGTDPELSIEAIESYIPSNNRSQLIIGRNNTLIVDAYNANPTSMKAALENFMEIKTSSKGVIIGDMLELGKDSVEEHKAILNIVEKMNLKYIFIIGKEFANAAKGDKYFAEKAIFKENSEKLKEYLSKNKLNNTTLLVKGSRGIKLETVLDLFI
ncbi:MAG: UDP-N-acetylmuramoyl-tripeptide--D-alanyl-D-alanine ligase [Bacteroidales bacterium]